MLILAMYTVIRKPCIEQKHLMNTTLFATMRRIFMVRVAESTSLTMLQVGLLLVYYACGHGLSKDAHIILTTCVGLARLLHIDVDSAFIADGTCNQIIACRWALVLLDRHGSQPTLPNQLFHQNQH